MTSEDTRSAAVLYCPHCGNSAPQSVLLTQGYDEKLYTVPTGEESVHPAVCTVTKCESCSQILVYEKIYEWEAYTETALGNLVYPKQLTFNKSVPTRVRETYHEALKVKNSSPVAYVMLARKALEEICIDKGVYDRNLQKGLQSLAEKGELPNTLAEASDLIRQIGNAGAHASDTKINVLHVLPVEDFVKAIIEYLYVAPARIREFKQTYLNAQKKQGNAD